MLCVNLYGSVNMVVASEAAVKRSSVRRLPFTLNQDAVITPMTTKGALEPRVLVAPFFPDPHPGSLSNERSRQQVRVVHFCLHSAYTTLHKD